MTKCLSAFVAMPYGEQFEEVYLHGIIPIMSKFPGWNITVNRADTKSRITEHLWAHVLEMLTNSDLVIVDTTGKNPNVMTELGMALTSHRTTFQITQDKDVPDILEGFIRTHYSLDALDRLTDDLVCAIEPKLKEIAKARAEERPTGPGRSTYRDKKAKPHRLNLSKRATELRDLGCAARDRGDLDSAQEYLKQAILIEKSYWEAKYNLAFVLSLLMLEDEASRLAKQVVEESLDGDDFEFVFKAYNMLSGIHKRAKRYEEALDCIRWAYFYSHLLQLTKDCEPPHVVPIKNRAALEKTHGDEAIYLILIKELQTHPEFEEVRAELEEEIGKIPG